MQFLWLKLSNFSANKQLEKFTHKEKNTNDEKFVTRLKVVM